ncbi:19410_t:CDS:1, partial [Entrophospora sp. SA101]
TTIGRKCESEETPGNKREEESSSSEYEAEKKNKLLEAFLNLQKFGKFRFIYKNEFDQLKRIIDI